MVKSQRVLYSSYLATKYYDDPRGHDVFLFVIMVRNGEDFYLVKRRREETDTLIVCSPPMSEEVANTVLRRDFLVLYANERTLEEVSRRIVKLWRN